MIRYIVNYTVRYSVRYARSLFSTVSEEKAKVVVGLGETEVVVKKSRIEDHKLPNGHSHP